jgi:hypothetical protein
MGQNQSGQNFGQGGPPGGPGGDKKDQASPDSNSCGPFIITALLRNLRSRAVILAVLVVTPELQCYVSP